MWQDNAHGALVLREAGGVGRWEERRERVAKGRRGLKRLIMPPMGCELMLARMRSDRAPAHGSELPPHATYIDIWAVRYTWTHGPCLRGRRQSACVLHCAAPCRAHTLRDLCLASTEQVDAKVEPTYIRVKAKKHTLQLLLPAEVLTDASTAQRSTTTGHLVLTCPKVHPRRRLSAAPRMQCMYMCTAPARHLPSIYTASALHARCRCIRSSSPRRRRLRRPSPSPPSTAGRSTGCCPRPATTSRAPSTSAGSCYPRLRARPSRSRTRRRSRLALTFPMRKMSRRSAEVVLTISGRARSTLHHPVYHASLVMNISADSRARWPNANSDRKVKG